MAGKPFPFTGVAALTLMPTQQAGLRPGARVRVGGDTHLHRDRLDPAREPNLRPLRRTRLTRRPKSIDGDRIEDVTREGHGPQPEVAVRC